MTFTRVPVDDVTILDPSTSWAEGEIPIGDDPLPASVIGLVPFTEEPLELIYPTTIIDNEPLATGVNPLSPTTSERRPRGDAYQKDNVLPGSPKMMDMANLLPPEILYGDNGNQLLKTLIDSTIDRWVNTPDLDSMSGIIGHSITPETEVPDAHVHELTDFRQNNQLQPIIHTLADVPFNHQNMSWGEMLIKMEKAGVNITQEADKIFASHVYSFQPPIDANKFANYTYHYWIKELPVAPITINGVFDASALFWSFDGIDFLTDTFDVILDASALNASDFNVFDASTLIISSASALAMVGAVVEGELSTDADTFTRKINIFGADVNASIYTGLVINDHLRILGTTFVVSEVTASSLVVETTDDELALLPFDNLENIRVGVGEPSYYTQKSGEFITNQWVTENYWVHLETMRSDAVFITNTINGTFPRAQVPIIELAGDVLLDDSPYIHNTAPNVVLYPIQYVDYNTLDTPINTIDVNAGFVAGALVTDQRIGVVPTINKPVFSYTAGVYNTDGSLSVYDAALGINAVKSSVTSSNFVYTNGLVDIGHDDIRDERLLTYLVQVNLDNTVPPEPPIIVVPDPDPPPVVINGRMECVNTIDDLYTGSTWYVEDCLGYYAIIRLFFTAIDTTTPGIDPSPPAPVEITPLSVTYIETTSVDYTTLIPIGIQNGSNYYIVRYNTSVTGFARLI